MITKEKLEKARIILEKPTEFENPVVTETEHAQVRGLMCSEIFKVLPEPVELK